MDIAEVDDAEVIGLQGQVLRLEARLFCLQEAGLQQGIADDKNEQGRDEDDPAAAVPGTNQAVTR